MPPKGRSKKADKLKVTTAVKEDIETDEKPTAASDNPHIDSSDTAKNTEKLITDETTQTSATAKRGRKPKIVKKADKKDDEEAKIATVIDETKDSVPEHENNKDVPAEVETVRATANSKVQNEKGLEAVRSTRGRKPVNKESKVTEKSKAVQESKKMEVEEGDVKNDNEKALVGSKELKVVIEKCDANDVTLRNAIKKEEPVKKARGRGKRTAKGDASDEEKPIKVSKASGAKDSHNEKNEDFSSGDFNNESITSNGKKWNLKIASWNVNGIRAWFEKEGMSFIKNEDPDIMCFQETKCSNEKLPDDIRNVKGYYCYWLSGDKEGYSGVGLLSKKEPLTVTYGIGYEEHDNEGRAITVEYENFYLVATYVPNAGKQLVRLNYRMSWDRDFSSYLKKLDVVKPVILCGDLNVAHSEIDLANPKTNKKNAGFTKEERDGFSSLLAEGFVDSFRHLYPDTKNAYTFWTYMMNSRAKDVGWRLDYFVISKQLVDNLCDSVIRKQVLGSDHCPITLFLAI